MEFDQLTFDQLTMALPVRNENAPDLTDEQEREAAGA